MRRALPAYIGALMLTASAPAMAQYSGMVEVDLNMRAGPSTSFPVVTTIPSDTQVTINGCINGYDWCDVSWSNNRGWVYGEYVNYQYQGRSLPIAEVRAGIEVPIVSFSFNTYWDTYYRDRPWYDRRDRWRSVWRSDPLYDRVRTGRDWDRDRDRQRVGDRDDRRRFGDRDRDDDRRRMGERDDNRRFGDRDRDGDRRRVGDRDDNRWRAGDDRRDRDRVGGRDGRDADRSDRSSRFGTGSGARPGSTSPGQGTTGTSSEQTGSINRPATGSTSNRGSDAGDRPRFQRGGGTSPGGTTGGGNPGGAGSPGAGSSGGGSSTGGSSGGGGSN